MNIDKDFFEASLSFAMHPDESIYNAMAPYLNEEFTRIQNNLLGIVVALTIDDGNHEELDVAVGNLTCLSAICRHLRGLDLVLTENGFGIVSNTNIAPASQQRVDALLQECLNNFDFATDRVLDLLIATPDWFSTRQAQSSIATLFEMRRFLHEYAGMSDGTGSHDAWIKAKRLSFEADIIVRDLISSAQMDALLLMERYHTEAKPIADAPAWAIELIRRFIGSYIAGNKDDNILNDLYNYMEANLDAFPEYAASAQYKANHYADYQNTEESSAFFF